MQETLDKGVLGLRGNLPVQERLLSYLRGGRIHPAAILAGPPSSGKLRLAKNIAKFLLCPAKSGKAPFCDECSTCRRIEKEIHPDVLICREEGEDNIKIDTVRELCHQMLLTPVEGQAKICIVDECHRMNVASANAFLKTLEEPGPGRYFWLSTSQIGSLLPTILSRCLKFRLRPENAGEPTEKPVAEAYAPLWEEARRENDPSLVISALDKKEKAQAFLNYLQGDLRDQVVNPKPTSKSCLWLLDRFEKTVKLEARLRSNANYGLMLESFLSQNFFTKDSVNNHE